jgi:hypothetical protein
VANGAKITIRVATSRGGSTVSFRSVGSSGSQSVSGLAVDGSRGPAVPNATPAQFWAAVLTVVQAEIAALPPA